MKLNVAPFRVFIALLFLAVSYGLRAQSPGLVIRPSAAPYSAVLDPNQDGFTSPSSTGFVSFDTGAAYSEIPYKVIPPFALEPVSDLLRGPSTLYSDLVRSVDGSGFYVYSDGTNLLFRVRVGSIVSGSKGYSILLDTDNRFGATGPYADPNFQPATTGVSGNPGFELEVVLETNFRVAIYNVDGASTTTLVTSYSVNSNSQISVALSTVSGTPDYFYDFYVPVSALPGVSASTPLRMSATTVMSPQGAIGGPKSDIYGIDDAAYNDYMKSWTTFINSQPPTTITTLSTPGAGLDPICTAAPVLTAPISAGTVTVSGTWTAADASRPQSATITLFVNGSSAGTTTVSSGGNWQITDVAISGNDLVYAKAQAAGESSCLESNLVKAISCATQTSLSGVGITCASLRGFDGTRPGGATVRIYTVTTSGYTLFADDNSTTYKITYPGSSTRWVYDGVNVNSSDPCTGGATDVPAASYAVTVQLPGQCESDYYRVCTGLTPTADPAITQTTVYNSTTAISGTATANATVRLFINGKQGATPTTANASGSYSFSSLVLNIGDIVEVAAQSTGQCISNRASRIVTCFSSTPVIATDNQGNLIAGATAIAGRSGEPSGTTIRVYDHTNVLIGSTTVATGGAWSLAATVVSGKSYYATAQNGTCGVSIASALAPALPATTVCPTITGSYNESSSTVSGTLASSFTGTVRLYVDGIQAGSVSLSGATAWSIGVAAGSLYPGGVLTATTQAGGSAEKTDCPGSVTVSCLTPVAPSVSPAAASLATGQATTFTVSNSVSGILYSIADGSGVNYATSKFGTGGSLVLTTKPFTSSGTYNLNVKATSLSGPGCESVMAIALTVGSSLPVTFININAKSINNQITVNWTVADEDNVLHYEVERSFDCRSFETIARVDYKKVTTATNSYSFIDKAGGQKLCYRIKQVDINGHYQYSGVIEIGSNSNGKSLVVPNPAIDHLTVNFSSQSKELVTIQLLDINGRVVYQTKTVVLQGTNAVEINNLGALGRGQYVISLLRKEGAEYYKVALQ